MAAALRRALRGEGIVTDVAAGGEEALRLARSREPDAVVLDVMMPVLDGWGVLELLQGTASSPPVLVVSAKSAPADVARARDLGAADFLAKPFDGDDLLAKVAALLAT